MPDLKHDLQFHRPQIEQYLTTAILTRYYYNRGAIERSIREDKMAAEAIKLLEDPMRYRELLAAPNKAKAEVKL